MRNSFTQAIKIFFNPETIVPFILGSVFLAVFNSAVYDILKNSFGSQTPTLILVAIGSLLMLFLCIVCVSWLVSRRLARFAQLPVDLAGREPKKHRGLILMVSQPDPCEQAIRYHLPRLKRCWLVCSVQTLEIAEKLRQKFPQVCQDTPIVISDIYNPLEFCTCINKIYRDRLPQGWAESDVIADFTGMTAHGSVGMVLATLGTDRPLQYTPAKLDPDTRRPIAPMDPIEIALRPRRRPSIATSPQPSQEHKP